MKKFLTLLMCVVSLACHGYAWGISIIYEGFECFAIIDDNDPSSNLNVIESKFEVSEVVGGGFYRLRLTGGVPRFTSDSQEVCIDSIAAIGFSGVPETEGLPSQLSFVEATGYFSGTDLVISANSIYTDLSAIRGAFSSFSSSRIYPISNTLFFKFNPQKSTFVLQKLIHNKGFTHTSTGSATSIPFLETILPSFNDSVIDKPVILTPTINIEYQLIQ